MKNFTKKLALLLVFAMVLGVVAPGNVAKASENRKVFLDFATLTFCVGTDKSNKISDYDYTQYVDSKAPTEDKIKAIKEKDWVTVDAETSVDTGDLSWFNKKKDSYLVVRKYENGAYTYIVSDKIAKAEDAFKVLYTTSAEFKGDTKTPAYTSAQSIGSEATGYVVFYTGKGTETKVLTPTAVDYRVDGTYDFHRVYNKVGTEQYFIKALKRMTSKGGTLLFVQDKADHGDSRTYDDTTGWPSNKEVKFKLAAQKAAPTVKVGIDHVVPLKAGQEYRVVNAADGSQKGPWVNVEKAHAKADKNGRLKVGKILIEDLVVSGGSLDASRWVDTDGTLNAARLADGEVKLQVRTAATTKAVASKVYSVIVSQQAISATSAASVTGGKGVDVTIEYAVSYDPTKGLKITNNLTQNTDPSYEFTFTTSGASVTGDNKWTTVKATKNTTVKSLADSKTKEAYTKIWVRKSGDKSKNLLASNMIGFDLENVTKVTQTITEVANGTIEGVSGAAVKVTSDGAVTVTIPKAAVSDGAISDKSFDVTVSNVTKTSGEVAFKANGTNSKIKLAKSVCGTNKVTIKIQKIDQGTTGDTEYKFELESLKFTVKVVIGN